MATLTDGIDASARTFHVTDPGSPRLGARY